jgi:hypothetical protein
MNRAIKDYKIMTTSKELTENHIIEEDLVIRHLSLIVRLLLLFGFGFITIVTIIYVTHFINPDIENESWGKLVIFSEEYLIQH